MNTTFWIVAIAAVLLVVVLKAWLGRLRPEQARVIQQKLAQGARLVDVRTPGEFSGGHLAGAINVPLSELGTRSRDLGPKKKPVVVYCHSGARSGHAVRLLRHMGYDEVLDLKAMSNGRAVQIEQRT